MFILVDERISVATEYVAGFGEQGVSALGLRAEQFQAWLGATGSDDMAAVQGFVLAMAIMYVALNLMVDMANRALDPRAREA